MKTLFKYLLLILAFFFVKINFGTLAGVVLIALVLAFRIWDTRATLLTRLATHSYLVKDNKQKAASYYEKAYKTGTMPYNCRVVYSSFCLREGKLEKAKQLLMQVINSRFSKPSEKIGAKHNLAVVLWREGKLEEGIETIKEVHDKEKSSNTYGTYGVLLLERAKLSNPEDALPFMLEAYDYNEDDKTIADNLGELYYIMGEYEKAAQIYEKLLKNSFTTPMPYYNYGRALKALGKHEEAKAQFLNALDRKFTTVMTITREEVEKELELI